MVFWDLKQEFFTKGGGEGVRGTTAWTQASQLQWGQDSFCYL